MIHVKEGLLARDWTTDADHAFIGFDFYEIGVDPVVSSVGSVQHLRTHGPVARVNINGANQPLFPELSVERHAPAHVPQANFTDAHTALH